MDFETVEKARLAYAEKIKRGLIIGVIILAVIITIGMSSGGGVGIVGVVFFLAFFVTLTYFVFNYFLYKNEHINYKKAYKGYFVEQNMKKIFTELKYSHELGIPSTVPASTGMIRTGDRFYSNDFTTGKYHDVGFSQADVTIQEEHTDSDGDTYYTTIFKGRWMVFEFPKKFAYRIEVVQKGFPAKKVPKTGRNGRKFEKQNIESSTFHKKFKIYAEDGFETFYVLDPALIDHIETLSNNYKGKLLLCFVDNKLHVGLHDNKDAFEPPSPLKKIDEQKETEKINLELKTITDFVDYLKLDKKIFTNK